MTSLKFDPPPPLSHYKGLFTYTFMPNVTKVSTHSPTCMTSLMNDPLLDKCSIHWHKLIMIDFTRKTIEEGLHSQNQFTQRGL